MLWKEIRLIGSHTNFFYLIYRIWKQVKEDQVQCYLGSLSLWYEKYCLVDREISEYTSTVRKFLYEQTLFRHWSTQVFRPWTSFNPYHTVTVIPKPPLFGSNGVPYFKTSNLWYLFRNLCMFPQPDAIYCNVSLVINCILSSNTNLGNWNRDNTGLSGGVGFPSGSYTWIS